MDNSYKTNLHEVEAVLHIRDILYVNGPIIIDGLSLDAVVNVDVFQTGINRLEIEYFEVGGNIVDITNDDGSILYVGFEEGLKSSMAHILNNFIIEVERIALEQARNTPEENWDYRLTE